MASTEADASTGSDTNRRFAQAIFKHRHLIFRLSLVSRPCCRFRAPLLLRSLPPVLHIHITIEIHGQLSSNARSFKISQN